MKQLIIIGLIVFSFIVFFPQIASTPFGKRFFLEAIQTKTHTTVTAKKLSLSWLGPQRFSELAFHSSQFNGSIHELHVGVPLWSMLPLFQLKNIHRINGNISVDNGFFEFSSEQLPRVEINSFNGSLHLQKSTTDFIATGNALQNSTSGTFSIQGQIQEFRSYTAQGEFNHFPTLPIARILQSRDLVDENLFVQSLGDSFTLKGSVSYRDHSGNLDLFLQSQNLVGEIHGAINNHQLTLNRPLTATMQLTPQLCQWILRDVNPLLVSGVQAKNPTTLRIEPSNFLCPLDAFRIQNIQIGQATLDLGQIVCQNNGSLAHLNTLFKNSLRSSSNEISLWLTPLSFHLQHGKLKADRLDILIAHSIHVCTWGKVDLENDQLDMFLGIPADTLKKSFHLSNIPDEFVLKIPITGTTKKPNFATKAAAAKIAALIASENTPHQWLTEGIMNIFSKGDSDVPPAHHPFPWELSGH